MEIIKSFDVNRTGRDFVVGDIHGCFHVLQEALITLAFDMKNDRLFSVGDLVNRGPFSHQVLWWLNQPWFHAVKGNHEIMALMGFHGADPNNLKIGDWLSKIHSKAELEELYWKLNHLPIAMDVKTATGRFGIIHGDILHTSWNMFLSDLKQDGPNSKLAERTLWKRSRYKHNVDITVEGVDIVYTGHTVVDEPHRSANVLYIDTGCCYGRYLTIVNANTQQYLRTDYFVPRVPIGKA